MTYSFEMALAALKTAYELASRPLPSFRPVPAIVIPFPNLSLPPAGNDGGSNSSFRDALTKIERRLTEDVDRWLAQMEDIHTAITKSSREIISMSPMWPPKEINGLGPVIAQYDSGDKMRRRVIKSLKGEIDRIPSDVVVRSIDDVEFFRASVSRLIALLESERRGRARLRELFVSIRAEMRKSRGPVEIMHGVNIDGYKDLLMQQSRRCIERIGQIALLPSGWHDGEGEKISKPSVDAAYELIRTRLDLVGLFYIYPTIVGGIVFEFEFGGWDLSLEITPLGTIELYGVKVNDDEALEPLTFPDIKSPALMKEINDRIGATK